MAVNAKDFIAQDRGWIYGQGGNLANQAQDRATNASQAGRFYRSYGDEAYDPLIGGRGGYSPEERDAIIREQELQGILPSDTAYNVNYFNDAEKEAIAGKGYEREKYYNPDYSNDNQNTSEVFQRQARGGLRSGLYSSINEPDLRLSEDYVPGVNETLDTSEDRVRGAADPDRLRQDPGYADRVRMSDQEKQDIVTGAGISAGTGYRAAMGDLERQGRAAGVDPGGIAAMKERLLRESGGAAGDAATKARIYASDAAAGRESDIEKGRRAGETTAAEIGSSNELALGGRRLTAQDRMEALRLDTARDIGDRNTNAAQVSGQADIAGEQQINAQRRNVDQYNQGLGTELAVGQEKDAAERQRIIAEQRARTSQENQQNQFYRGAAVDSELSNRNAQVAQQRLKEAQEGRGYLTHQSDVASGNENAAAGQQIGLYGTQGGLQQGTVQAQANQDNQPKWWEKLTGAVAGGVGAYFGAKP